MLNVEKGDISVLSNDKGKFLKNVVKLIDIEPSYQGCLLYQKNHNKVKCENCYYHFHFFIPG